MGLEVMWFIHAQEGKRMHGGRTRKRPFSSCSARSDEPSQLTRRNLQRTSYSDCPSLTQHLQEPAVSNTSRTVPGWNFIYVYTSSVLFGLKYYQPSMT